MSLMESKGTLSKAVKNLFARWTEVKGVWSDTQSQEFEKTFLAQIEQDTRTALGALDRMEQVLQKIHTDCE